MPETRVIITGCRSWDCSALAGRILDRLKARYGDSLILVHGAASGVDSAFDAQAILKAIPREPHPACWDRDGSRAGPLRNAQMVSLGAAFVIACHPDLKSSNGTRDCVRRAQEAGIPVYLIDSEEGEPRKLES